MKFKLILAVILSAIGLFTARAEAATLSCQGCTYEEMRRAAEDHLAHHGPGSSIQQLHTYVVNVMDGTVRKFTKIQYVHEDPEIPVEVEIRELEVEPEVRTLINNLKNELDGTGYHITIPGPTGAAQKDGHNFPASAYDNMRNPSQELAVTNYINTTREAAFQRFAAWVNAFNPLAGFNPDAIVVTFEVSFSDGSTALYNYSNGTKEWSRIPKSSRDSNGNIIPEVPDDVDGGGVREYEFVADEFEFNRDFENFRSHVTQMGWNFAGSSNGYGGYSVVCAGDICVVTLIR